MAPGSFFFASGECLENVLGMYKMSSLRRICEMVDGFVNDGHIRSRVGLYQLISTQSATVQAEFRRQVDFLLGGTPSDNRLVRPSKRKVEKMGELDLQ
jgi:hypothetical protein